MGIIGDIFAYTPTGMAATKLGELIGPTVLNAEQQAKDLDAIHNFFARTTPETDEGTRLKDEWMAWFQGLTWYQKNVDESVAALAINKRNAFVRAEATTREEKELVDKWIKNTPAYDPVTKKPIFTDSSGDRVVPKTPLQPNHILWIVGGGVAMVALVVANIQFNTFRKLAF